MRLLRNAWGADNIAACVKFFAESVLELTNNYSAPSYRHRTLTTPAKAFELKSALRDVRSRIVKKPYLTPMIAEFDHSILEDPIAKLQFQKNGLSVDLFRVQIEDPLEKISAKVSLFLDLMSPYYTDAAEEIITSLCESGKREKDAIRRCADGYISHLISMGVSRRHIHVTAKRFFCVADIAGQELDELRGFFKACKVGTENTYDILLGVSEQVGAYLTATLPTTVFDSFDDLPIYFQQGASGKFSEDTEKFVIIQSAPSKDPFSAIMGLKGILEIIHAFHFVFPNGEKWTLPTSAFAYDSVVGGVYFSELDEYVHEGRRVGSPKKHSDLISKLTNFTFSKAQERSGHKIVRALLAASTASRTPETDVRLISIWSAFEALLPHPSKDGENTVRINHFESYITPLVTAEYINNTFRNFHNDLARNFKGEFYRFINAHGGTGDRYENFLNMFFASTAVKKDFMKLISTSELLLYRAHELEKLANSPAQIKAKIDGHADRVSWQLHRIYRARNAIVHSGQSSKFSPQLTENAFSYFKSLMSVLVQAGEKYGVSNSDSLFELCASICRAKKENLFKMETKDASAFLRASIASPI